MSGKEITVSFVFQDSNNQEVTKSVKGKVGDTILQLAHRNKIPLEGACEGGMVCSTCHVTMNEECYSKLPEATEEEQDTLDLADEITNTSRLGCQIRLSEELDGIILHIPNCCRGCR